MLRFCCFSWVNTLQIPLSLWYISRVLKSWSWQYLPVFSLMLLSPCLFNVIIDNVDYICILLSFLFLSYSFIAFFVLNRYFSSRPFYFLYWVFYYIFWVLFLVVALGITTHISDLSQSRRVNILPLLAECRTLPLCALPPFTIMVLNIMSVHFENHTGCCIFFAFNDQTLKNCQTTF